MHTVIVVLISRTCLGYNEHKLLSFHKLLDDMESRAERVGIRDKVRGKNRAFCLGGGFSKTIDLRLK